MKNNNWWWIWLPKPNWSSRVQRVWRRHDWRPWGTIMWSWCRTSWESWAPSHTAATPPQSCHTYSTSRTSRYTAADQRNQMRIINSLISDWHAVLLMISLCWKRMTLWPLRRVRLRPRALVLSWSRPSIVHQLMPSAWWASAKWLESIW